MGLFKYADRFNSVELMILSLFPIEVRIMIGTKLPFFNFRISLHNWTPSIKGIWKSNIQRSNVFPSLNHFRAIKGLSVATGNKSQSSSCVIKIFLLVWLSSTMRTFLPFNLAIFPLKYIFDWEGTESAIIVKKNDVPFPTSLSTQIFPPIISERRLLITKPRPVPPYVLVVEASTWLKDLNNLSILSEGIPIPVSLTIKRISYFSSSIFLALTDTNTSPSEVNFIALFKRLVNICLNLVTSPLIVTGVLFSIR